MKHKIVNSFSILFALISIVAFVEWIKPIKLFTPAINKRVELKEELKEEFVTNFDARYTIFLKHRGFSTNSRANIILKAESEDSSLNFQEAIDTRFREVGSFEGKHGKRFELLITGLDSISVGDSLDVKVDVINASFSVGLAFQKALKPYFGIGAFIFGVVSFLLSLWSSKLRH